MTATTVVSCPKCGRENGEGAAFCLHCGTPLARQGESTGGSLPSFGAARPANLLQAAMAPPKSPYAALRNIASLCRLLGWAFVGLAALQAIAGLIVLFSSFLSGLGVILAAAIMGAIGYVFWNMIAESISVILDIEANTRRTAELLAQRN
jgi:hypothetical protein